MSSLESLINGKLIPTNLTVQEYADKHNIELKSYYDSLEEQLSYDDDNKFVIIAGMVYTLKGKILYDESPEFCKMSKNEDGSIDIDFSYYNGGTSLIELIEQNIHKL